MKLVLFDIDGTILLGGGAGRRAIHRALIEVFGTTGPAGHWFDGKTDPQIVRELMGLAGCDAAHIDANMSRLLTRYVEELRVELAGPVTDARLLPGVGELLDVLEARDDVALGLLTGNLRDGAEAKLASVGIDPSRFAVGAFGSDHELRPELPAIAQQRARERFGQAFDGAAIVVIGDTPADLTCGLGVGARAIGVATGRYSEEELRAYHPAAVFANLSDTPAVVDAILTA